MGGPTKGTYLQEQPVAMGIESPVFENNATIPKRYTRFGENRQPPLIFGNIPPETVTLALLMDDPDAATGVFTHWIVFNLNPQLKGLEENSNLDGADVGMNDSGKPGYIGPFPPSGEQRYFFRLYALDCALDLPDATDRGSFLQTIEGHVIAKAGWIGRVAAQQQSERKK